MDKILPIIIPGTIGVFSALIAIITNRYFDKRNKILATKREQLEKVFAPLEVLTKVNKLEFERFSKMEKVTQAERDFIEQSIWHPNHLEIRRIIMTNSHLLNEMPQEFLDLLDHINLWLFVYETKYVLKTYTGPVYAGPSGKRYPRAADDFINFKATEYRKAIKQR